MKIDVEKDELKRIIWAMKIQRRQLVIKAKEMEEILQDTTQLEVLAHDEIGKLGRLMEKLLTNNSGNCRLCGLDVNYHGCLS